MAVSVNFDVELGGFISGVKQGQQIMKGLNAEMKAAESEFKRTGDAEQKLNAQTKTLNSQLNVQKGIADKARKALELMKKNGVDEADAAYQKLYVQLMNAEAGANEAQAALNALGGGAEQAAAGADKLGASLGGISKKMSLEQVITGINTITSGLESAAKKAVELGQNIWNEVIDAARRAGDTAKIAEMYDIPIQRYKQMLALEEGGLKTSTDAILTAQDKLNKGIGKDSKDTLETLESLGIRLKSLYSDEGVGEFISRDSMEVFWEAGQALMAMGDAYDKEAAAQALFGRGWKELKPLFSEYKTLEEYNAALENTTISSEDSTKNLDELADSVGALEQKWTSLKEEIIGAVAPGLEKAANALSTLLENVMAYLKTEDGQKALQDLETAVSGLFDDLGKIDPESVVSGFTEVFNTVVDSLKWLVTNKDSVIKALEGVVIGWGALRLTGGALDILRLINGMQGLGGKGTGGTSGGTTGGSAGWFTGMGNAIIAQASSFLPALQQMSGMFIGPAIDWLTHEGPLGGIFQGTESMQGWLERMKQEQAERTASFEEDWRNNELMKPFFELGENSIRFWDEAWKNLWSANVQINPEDLEPMDEQTLQLRLMEQIREGGVPIPTEPEVPETAAQDIAAQVGTVVVPVTLEWDRTIGGAGGGADWNVRTKHANGLPFVPYDGYLAELHKGERVVPAREVQSRSFSSNLYVENMNMSGGIDAAGLAASIAAAQRRQMSGYGS